MDRLGVFCPNVGTYSGTIWHAKRVKRLAADRIFSFDYSEGREFDIVYRFADGYIERLPGFAEELVQLHPNVILAPASGPAVAAKKVSSTIPNVCFRRSAYFVDKILHGTAPSDLLVEFPTHLELVVNLKTAKALGLAISPALLARADDVQPCSRMPCRKALANPETPELPPSDSQATSGRGAVL